MRPVYQRYTHGGDDPMSFGDCLRCAIASILELDRDSVPHFRHAERETSDGVGRMWWQVKHWLQGRGLGLFQQRLQAETVAEALEWCRIHNGEHFLILGGITTFGGAHAVVVHQGAIVHDPAGEGPSSLVHPLEDGHWVVLAITHRPELRADLAAPGDGPVEIPPTPDFSLLDQHERIALSFSGGKDSLCLAHLLRPHWPRMTFYHCDTSDLLPETREIAQQMEELVTTEGGRYCHITSHSIAYQEKHGLVSDIVPYDATLTGQALLHGKAGRMPMIDRTTCCSANLWKPLQSRMQADNVSLVIRGTRRQDPAWGWLESSGLATGPTTFHDPATGQLIWTPIADWSVAQVFAYLRSVGAPIARYYEGEFKHSGPECARCTAWLDEGRAAYLKKYHPAIAADYFVRLSRVRSAIRPTLERLEDELAELSAPIT